MKKKVFALVALLILDAVVVYLTLPTVSIHNIGLWIMVLLNVAAVACILSLADWKAPVNKKTEKISAIICAVLAVGMLVGAIASSRMLNSRRYTELLDIKMADNSALPTVEDIKKIPLMDTESSKVLGDRKIGSLNEIVSQFEVSSDYMTISYKNAPVKVSALKYAGFWKWNANKNTGIPGYVSVDPNGLTAEYIELKKGMIYVPSAYLGQDLARHIYFKHPTVFFDNLHFEIDEQGNPFYVASTYEYTIGLFGGKKVTGAVVVNPVSGDVQLYKNGQLPQWVDIVYNGNYVAKYFDIYGRLINGFWNSLFGQKGLIESTTTTIIGSDGETTRDHDFGYIVKDNDVYIYTGVTAVTNDESNIGYLMANERTGEVLVSYFEATDEDSVMRAAEGEVQEKGYRASFPSLININGSPAYVMVLKDNLGLVKMYAIVDAAQYSHMVVEDTLEKALGSYSKGAVVTGLTEKTVTVRKIELVTIDGDTLVYLVDADNNIYYSEFDSRALLVEAGDELTILTDGTVFRFQN